MQLSRSHIDKQIIVKECLMSNKALEWVTRSQESCGERIIMIGDNVAVISALTKRRSSRTNLQAPFRLTAAYELATDIHIYHVWTPTKINPAYAPSRRYKKSP